MTRVYNKITPETADKILIYFYNNNDNRSTVIAKELKLPTHFVNYVLDIHLKYKKNAYITYTY